MIFPSVSIPFDGVRTPDHLAQPYDSNFTVQVSKIRRTKMIQLDVDSENTAEKSQIGVSVQTDTTVLSSMTENTPPEPVLTEISSTLSTKSSNQPYTPIKRPVWELDLISSPARVRLDKIKGTRICLIIVRIAMVP